MYVYVHTTTCIHPLLSSFFQGEDLDENDRVDQEDLSMSKISDDDVAELQVEVQLRHGDDIGKHILDISKLGDTHTYIYKYIDEYIHI